MALALDHIHRAEVIHLDVKPSNIFLVRSTAGAGDAASTADEQARLGDFDVSVPSGERAGAVSATTAAATVIGYTPEYAAPEVVRARRATTAADIYSLGLVLLDSQLAMRGKPVAAAPNARPACLTSTFAAATSPEALRAALRTALTEPAASDDLLDLLAAMLAEEAKQRPSAALVLAHRYLADDARALAEQEEERMGPECQCAICFATTPAAFGLPCPRQEPAHFLCDECLAAKVAADSRVGDDNDLARRGGRVFCVGYSIKGNACHAAAGQGPARPEPTPYADTELARHVPPEAFELYMRARRELVAAQLSRERDEAVRRGVEAELERLRNQSEDERRFSEAHKHVCETILTLRWARRCAQRCVGSLTWLCTDARTPPAAKRSSSSLAVWR